MSLDTRPQESVVTIPLTEMYADIKAMRTDMTTLLTRSETMSQMTLDHESRLRALERRIWIASGFLALLALIAPRLGEIARILGG